MIKIATILDAVINLKDNFSGTIQAVEKSMGSCSRTARKMGRDVQKTGRSLERMGGKLTATVTAPIVAGIAASVNEFAKLEQSIGGVETLFKGSAGEIIKNSETAYKRAGVSANSYMEEITSFSASLLQGLGGDTEQAAKIADMAMVDMADNANKFGTDIASIQNSYQGFAKDNFTMLDNLKLGYGGTASEMARLINDTGVMGKAFEATAKNVKEVPFYKMIEAIHKVQEQMDITGTTAKEAMETVSGSIGMAKASVQDFLGGLGNPEADVEQLAKNMVEAFKIAAGNIKRVVSTIWDNIPLEDWQKDLLKFAVSAGPVLLVIGKITTGVGTSIITFAKLSKEIKKVGLIGAIFNPGTKVVAIIIAMAGAAILLYKNWDKVKEIVQKVKDKFEVFSGTAETAKEHLNSIKDTIKTVAEVLTAVFAPALVKTGIQAVAAGGKIAGSFVISIIKAGTQAVITAAKITGHLIVSLVSYAAQGWKTVASIVATTGAWIAQKGVMVATTAATYAMAGAQKLLNLVMSMNPIGLVIVLLSGLALGLIALYRHSEKAREIMDRLWNGIMNGAQKAKESVGKAVEDIKTFWNSLKEFFQHPIQGTVNIVKKGANFVKDKIGHNAQGTNSWQGGLTWVGEQGPELVNLPKFTRIYSNDKSIKMVDQVQSVKQKLIPTNIPSVPDIVQSVKQKLIPTNRPINQEEAFTTNNRTERKKFTINIPKLADQIVVREDSDIDKIADALIRKIEKASLNMA